MFPVWGTSLLVFSEIVVKRQFSLMTSAMPILLVWWRHMIAFTYNFVWGWMIVFFKAALHWALNKELTQYLAQGTSGRLSKGGDSWWHTGACQQHTDYGFVFHMCHRTGMHASHILVKIGIGEDMMPFHMSLVFHGFHPKHSMSLLSTKLYIVKLNAFNFLM